MHSYQDLIELEEKGDIKNYRDAVASFSTPYLNKFLVTIFEKNHFKENGLLMVARVGGHQLVEIVLDKADAWVVAHALRQRLHDSTSGIRQLHATIKELQILAKIAKEIDPLSLVEGMEKVEIVDADGDDAVVEKSYYGLPTFSNQNLNINKLPSTIHELYAELYKFVYHPETLFSTNPNAVVALQFIFQNHFKETILIKQKYKINGDFFSRALEEKPDLRISHWIKVHNLLKKTIKIILKQMKRDKIFLSKVHLLIQLFFSDVEFESLHINPNHTTITYLTSVLTANFIENLKILKDKKSDKQIHSTRLENDAEYLSAFKDKLIRVYDALMNHDEITLSRFSTLAIEKFRMLYCLNSQRIEVIKAIADITDYRKMKEDEFEFIAHTYAGSADFLKSYLGEDKYKLNLLILNQRYLAHSDGKKQNLSSFWASKSTLFVRSKTYENDLWKYFNLYQNSLPQVNESKLGDSHVVDPAEISIAKVKNLNVVENRQINEIEFCRDIVDSFVEFMPKNLKYVNPLNNISIILDEVLVYRNVNAPQQKNSNDYPKQKAAHLKAIDSQIKKFGKLFFEDIKSTLVDLKNLLKNSDPTDLTKLTNYLDVTKEFVEEHRNLTLDDSLIDDCLKSLAELETFLAAYKTSQNTLRK